MSEYPFFFTWTPQNAARPFALAGGDGSHFTLADGSRWLDLGALSYQVNAGHGRKRIVEAIKRQADELCLSSPSAVFPAKTELAERLLAMAGPEFSKVFFTLSGAEANENAIKIARQVTGRLKLVSRYRSYHGASMGALSLTGDWRRPPFEPGIPGVVHVQDCYCDRCPFGQRVETCKRECATNIGSTMALEGPRSVAAVFLEPVPGANGVLVPPAEYWPIVRAACDAEGALLVADEVLTGFGRTGKPFGFQHWGVTPDIITVAKGLASGYATIGAVIVRDSIARYFDDHTLACGLTYYAHPIACAAALETLKLYEDEHLFDHAARLGPILRRELDAIAARLRPTRATVPDLRSAVPAPIGPLRASEASVPDSRTSREAIDANGSVPAPIGAFQASEASVPDSGSVPAPSGPFVRSLGLLGALEIDASADAWSRLGAELVKAKLSLHVDPKRGTAIFSPPLCITEDELVRGMRSFGDCAVAAFGGT